jgi:hypothetical protein
MFLLPHEQVLNCMPLLTPAKGCVREKQRKSRLGRGIGTFDAIEAIK